MSAALELSTPNLACEAFVAALNEGRTDLAAECFARDGCLITLDRTQVHGREPLRAVLAQLISHRPRIEVLASRTVEVGAVALSAQRWRLGYGDAEPCEQAAQPLFVSQRISGEWRLIVAAPSGLGQER
jgi:SnoaL-like domain